jgi:hypothetical protein
MLKRSSQGPRQPEPIKFDNESEAGLAAAVADMGLSREQIVNLIVKDWLIGQAYIRADTIDENSETVGTA